VHRTAPHRTAPHRTAPHRTACSAFEKTFATRPSPLRPASSDFRHHSHDLPRLLTRHQRARAHADDEDARAHGAHRQGGAGARGSHRHEPQADGNAEQGAGEHAMAAQGLGRGVGGAGGQLWVTRGY
jgi:hypothetical protein